MLSSPIQRFQDAVFTIWQAKTCLEVGRRADLGGWATVIDKPGHRLLCSVSVSCVTSRACEAVGAKFASSVGVCSGIVSRCCCCAPLPRWYPAGAKFILLLIFSLFIVS